MKSLARLTVAALALLLSITDGLSAKASPFAIYTYTDRDTFLAETFAPVVVDTFNDLPRGSIVFNNTVRTVTPYSYTLNATGGLATVGPFVGGDTWMTTINSNTVMSLVNIASTFSDPGVNAIGAYFFVTDSNGISAVNETITVTINGGKAPLTSSTASATNFFGWKTYEDITSVEITVGATANRFATMNDVTFAVPEPSTYAMLGLAITTGGLCRIRRRVFGKKAA